MADGDPARADSRSGFEHTVGYASLEDRRKRRQEIIKIVQKRSTGKTIAGIETDLRIEFAAAGIPQMPEMIAVTAAGIGGSRLSWLRDAGRQLRTIVGGESPTGLRLERVRLAGDRWIAANLADEPSTQERLQKTDRTDESLKGHMPTHAIDRWPGPLARLIVIPGAAGGDEERIGVLLSRDFVGTVPPQDVQKSRLREAITRVEASDRQVMVRARIERLDTDGAFTMFIAVPSSRPADATMRPESCGGDSAHR